jgi:hypothetical protein
LRGCFREAFNDTLLALQILGVDFNPAPTKGETDIMFEQIKNEILSIGFDEIISIPRSMDPKIELAVVLLNDAGMPLPFMRALDFQLRLRYQCLLESCPPDTHGHDRFNSTCSQSRRPSVISWGFQCIQLALR